VAPIAAVIKPAPAVAPSADPKDTAAGAKWAKPNEAEIAARRAQKEQEKAEKERQKAAAAAAGGDAAPAAAGGKAPKGAAAAAPAAAAADEPLSSDELDLRVGLITAVDKHPKADRLFVETIDLGEPTGPRTIVSGLVAYYKAEDLLNKKVIVVANMKAKPLMGVPSNGMVLCASLTTGEGDAATTQLELVPIPGRGAAGRTHLHRWVARERGACRVEEDDGAPGAVAHGRVGRRSLGRQAAGGWSGSARQPYRKCTG
jgi:aminoacyl tRNA synthase complex-interacting multifunctional protein 1